MLKKYMFLVAIALALVTGCDKITIPGPGGDSNSSDIFVSGGINVANGYKTSNAIVWVELREGGSEGALITNAVIIVNEDTLLYSSYAGTYMDVIDYSASMNYDIEIRTDRGDFTISVEAPPVEELSITSPVNESQLPIGNDVEVTWDIQGESEDSLSVSYGYGDDDDQDVSLPASARRYVIPAEHVNREGVLNIWVSTYRVLSLSDFAPESMFFFSLSDNIFVNMVPSR